MNDIEVEAVARAICLSFGKNPMERMEASDAEISITIWRWEAYQPAARAAIEARDAALSDAGLVIRPRDPNDEMIAAAEVVWRRNRNLHEHQLLKNLYRAMTDAYTGE